MDNQDLVGNEADDAESVHQEENDEPILWEMDDNVAPAADDIFEPFIRPPRKNTYRVKFPAGYSPFDDARDPEADPDSYPPPVRKPFADLVIDVPRRLGVYWMVNLVVTFILRCWSRVPAFIKESMVILVEMISPILFWIASIETWRHCIGWLHYSWFYVLATLGYEHRPFECARLLREGPNRRFTVTSQFWHRRGCDGTFDGWAARGIWTIEV